MAKYSQSIWKMIKVVTMEMEPPFTAKDIVEAVHKKYPDDKVKNTSLRSIIIGCSVNHPSTHHYSLPEKFLLQVSRGQFRLYDPQKDGDMHEKISTGSRKTKEKKTMKKVHFKKVNQENKVSIPKNIRSLLKVGTDDYVGFILTEQGDVILKKVKARFRLM